MVLINFISGEIHIDWDKSMVDLEIQASEVIGYPGWRQFREGEAKIVANNHPESCE